MDKINIWRLKWVWLEIEDSRGQAKEAVNYLPFNDMDFQNRTEEVIDESAIWQILDSSDWYITRSWADGSLDGFVRNTTFWYILRNVLSDYWVSGPVSDLYDHIFKLEDDNTSQSISITEFDPKGSKIYSLWMIDSLDIEVNQNEYVTFSADVTSKKWETSTVEKTDLNFLSWDFAYRGKDVKVSMDPDWEWYDLLELNSFSLNIDKWVGDPFFAIGSEDPTEISNQLTTITGSLEKRRKNITEFEAKKWDIVKLKIELIDPNTDWDQHLTIILNRVMIISYEKDMGLDDIEVENIDFKILTDDWVDPIVVTLKNPKESYDPVE